MKLREGKGRGEGDGIGRDRVVRGGERRGEED